MSFINRIRTSRIIFRLVYILSPVLNIFSPRYSRAANSARRREAGMPGTLINGQRREPLNSLPYGAYTMGYNGCEVIAAYNLLCLVGREEPLADIADWFEGRALLLNGWGGTNIGSMRRFLRQRGLEFKALGPGRRGEYDAAFGKNGAGVLSFWTGQRVKNEKGRWNTLHTVAVKKTDRGVLVFNHRGLDTDAAEYTSLVEYISENGLLPVVFFALRD